MSDRQTEMYADDYEGLAKALRDLSKLTSQQRISPGPHYERPRITWNGEVVFVLTWDEDRYQWTAREEENR